MDLKFSQVAQKSLSQNDFPALPGQSQTREEILLGNLLGLSLKSKYTLEGLLQLIQKNQDSSILSLGCDLNSLGLDLNSQENIYSSMVSPFSDTSLQEQSFTTPSCYLLPGNPLDKISQVSDESLFYIFYSMPRDLLQECAAQELYNRNWRFHKEFKLWLCKDTSAEPVKSNGFERGLYIFFDPSSWSCVKKEWVLHYDQLEERS